MNDRKITIYFSVLHLNHAMTVEPVQKSSLLYDVIRISWSDKKKIVDPTEKRKKIWPEGVFL